MISSHFEWMITSHGFFKWGGIILHLKFLSVVYFIVSRNSLFSNSLRPSRGLHIWHIFCLRLLLLPLMCGNRFYRILKNRFLIVIHCCHRRNNNRCWHHSILHCRCSDSRSEKNGSWIIGVGAYTRFSSRSISRATMLPLIISSSRKTTCLVSTNFICLSRQ